MGDRRLSLSADLPGGAGVVGMTIRSFMVILGTTNRGSAGGGFGAGGGGGADPPSLRNFCARNPRAMSCCTAAASESATICPVRLRWSASTATYSNSIPSATLHPHASAAHRAPGRSGELHRLVGSLLRHARTLRIMPPVRCPTRCEWLPRDQDWQSGRAGRVHRESSRAPPFPIVPCRCNLPENCLLLRILRGRASRMKRSSGPALPRR